MYLLNPSLIEGFTTTPLSTAPSAPAVGEVKIYFKTDDQLYYQGSDGNEHQLTGTGGGGGSGITSLNGLTDTTQTFSTGTTGSDFGIVSAGGIHTFNIPNASGSARGLLTSSDWTTFNNKLSSIPNSGVSAGSYTNANITVGADGRITLASSGTGGGLAGSISAGQVAFATATDTIGGNANFIWNNTSGFLGIGNTSPGQKLHVTSGNILIDSTSEQSYMLKHSGLLNSNPNISNPIWQAGRVVEGGVANHSVFRYLFSSDSTVERSVFEIEDTGTVASVSDGTRRSHFEAFLNNGDVQPVIRISSAVGSGDAGIQLGAGGVTSPDVEFQRNGTNAAFLALGGSAKTMWYADAFVTQPGVNIVMANTAGLNPEFRFMEEDGNGSNYVAFKAPSALSVNNVYTLPSAYPTVSGQILAGTNSGILSWITASGASQLTNGRLTLISGTPVMTSDVINATNIYFTPYNGNYISLYNGSFWETITFLETSLSLSGYTANTNFDIFAYNNLGTLTLESVAWLNDTARSVSLSLLDGTYVKSSDNTRKYLGTIRTTGTVGECQFNIGEHSTSYVSGIKLFVYNYFNQVKISNTLYVNAVAWSYASATWRNANADANFFIYFINGLNEQSITSYYATSIASNSTTTSAMIGIGLDSTSAYSGSVGLTNSSGTPPNTSYNNAVAYYYGNVSSGLHYVSGIEYAGQSVSASFLGTGSSPGIYDFKSLLILEVLI